MGVRLEALAVPNWSVMRMSGVRQASLLPDKDQIAVNVPVCDGQILGMVIRPMQTAGIVEFHVNRASAENYMPRLDADPVWHVQYIAMLAEFDPVGAASPFGGQRPVSQDQRGAAGIAICAVRPGSLRRRERE